MRKIAIIGCTSRKKKYRCKAIELYQESSFFCKKLKYARNNLKVKDDDIYILSAEHHLIRGSEEIDPYDNRLTDKPKAARKEWAEESLRQIREEFNPAEDKLFLFCGTRYYEFLECGLQENNYQYEIPLRGKGGIGKQLQWLIQNTHDN